jgi:hypothetical protein
VSAGLIITTGRHLGLYIGFGVLVGLLGNARRPC